MIDKDFELLLAREVAAIASKVRKSPVPKFYNVEGVVLATHDHIHQDNTSDTRRDGHE